MGVPRMLETQRLFRCGMCGEVFPVLADYEQYYRTERPTACPNLRDPDRRCKVGVKRASFLSGERKSTYNSLLLLPLLSNHRATRSSPSPPEMSSTQCCAGIIRKSRYRRWSASW